MNVSAALANFVANTRFAQLSDAAVTQCRYALLDGIGVSLAATTLGEACDAFRQHVLLQGADGPCSVWGSGERSSASLAAFANGALAHALDFEDTHEGAMVHPNAAVIPAAIAVAQARGNISGEELVTAIAVGCDVVCRLGLALRVPLDQFGWYPPPILGAFGATAAAAHLYRLSPQQVLDAFSLTLSQATCTAEIKYNPQSVIRAVRDAFPAQAGVISAQLAARGVSGFAQPFEGKAGFFATFARGEFDAAPLLSGIGEHFEIERLSFKPWPCCRGTHIFIALLSDIIGDNRLAIEDVARIDVYGNTINRMLAEPQAGKRRPVTAIDAKFSIPYCLARTVLHGPPDLAAFFSDALCDQAVLAIAERIHYHVDADLPANAMGMGQGQVTVTSRDGRALTQSGYEAPGCPAHPMSEAELFDKFMQCCGYSVQSLSEAQSRELAESILHVEDINDLDTALFRFL